MKVLIFSVAYLPFVGGAEVAVKEITARLPQYEFDLVTVNLDRRQPSWEKVGNVSVRRVGFGRPAKYLFPLLTQLSVTKRYDLVWAIMANQAAMAAVLYKKRFPGTPFLLTLQEGDELQSLAYQFRLLGPKIFGVFQAADYIQTISHYLAAWARAMGARCPIEVVPNGVDMEKFQTVGFVEHDEAERVIITTSRLVPKNALDDLIGALQFLPKNVRLKIFGIGPEENNLRALAKRLGLWSRVNFMGYLDQERLPAQLAAADVFARPSRSEGLGNSFLEAMAAGLPVIGTPVGGIPDFLYGEDPNPRGESSVTTEDSPLGQTGWFCQVNHPPSLAEKIKFILDPAHRDQVKQVVGNAQALVREKYNWDTLAPKFNLIFQRLIRE